MTRWLALPLAALVAYVFFRSQKQAEGPQAPPVYRELVLPELEYQWLLAIAKEQELKTAAVRKLRERVVETLELAPMTDLPPARLDWDEARRRGSSEPDLIWDLARESD